MREPTFRQIALPVLWSLALAALLVWAARVGSPRLQVPPPVAVAVASTILAGSLALVARAARRPTLAMWLVVAVLIGFTGVAAWIALAGADETCRLVIDARTTGSSGGCRAAFGVAALMNAGLAAWAARLAWRASNRSS